jgi:hypothetical protein
MDAIDRAHLPCETGLLAAPKQGGHSRDVAVALRPHVVMRGAGFGRLAAAMALAKWA